MSALSIGIARTIDDDPLLSGLQAAVGRCPAEPAAELVCLTDLAVKHLLAATAWRLGVTASPDNTPVVLCSRVSKALGVKIPEHLRLWARDLAHAAGRRQEADIALHAQPDACVTMLAELRSFILGNLRAGAGA